MEKPYYKLVERQNFNDVEQYIQATKKLEKESHKLRIIKQELNKKQNIKASSIPTVTLATMTMMIVLMLFSLIFHLTKIITILKLFKLMGIITAVCLTIDITTYIKDKNAEKQCKILKQKLEETKKEIEHLKNRKRSHKPVITNFIKIKNPEKILQGKGLNLNQCSLSYSQDLTPQIVKNEQIERLRKAKETLIKKQQEELINASTKKTKRKSY